MENAIQWAAVGNLGPLREWVRMNPNMVNERFGASQSTLLFVAARGGQLAVVRYLLEECRADVNATCMNDLTPLHGAAYAGHDYVVEYLAAHGAQLRKNSRGQTPVDAAAEPCSTKTEDMKRRCLAALSHFFGGGGNVAAGGSPLLPTSSSTNLMVVTPPQQQPLQSNLPEQITQLLYKVGQSWSWRLTPHDYIISGLHGYRYQGNTYYTPVDLFYPIDGSMAFRARVDMNKLGGLVLSPKAAETYLDIFTGSLRLPPFMYPTILTFLEKGVTGLFEQTPPLSQKVANPRQYQRDKNMTRSVLRQCSAFADGCFQFNPTANCILGNIPIPTSATVGISLIPVQIKFIPSEPVEVASQAQLVDATKPLVFVVPPPDSMVLVATANVEGGTGQVFGMPSQNVPWSVDLLSQLLKEMQDAFSKSVPLRYRGPEDSVTRPTPAAAAAVPAVPHAAVSSDASSASSIPATPATPAPTPASSTAYLASDENLCVICMDQKKTHLLFPCRHVTFCKACAATYKEKASSPKNNSLLCPTCRQPIESMMEVYF